MKKIAIKREHFKTSSTDVLNIILNYPVTGISDFLTLFYGKTEIKIEQDVTGFVVSHWGKYYKAKQFNPQELRQLKSYLQELETTLEKEELLSQYHKENINKIVDAIDDLLS